MLLCESVEMEGWQKFFLLAMGKLKSVADFVVEAAVDLVQLSARAWLIYWWPRGLYDSSIAQQTVHQSRA